MISVKRVTKTFGDITAVKDVTFKVDKGEFVFITGPSGSGKTTLLRLILRDLIPDSGQVLFEGKNIVSLPESQIPSLRQKIGVVFQDFKVLPERTLRENVELAPAVLGVPQEQWRPRVDQVLKLVGLFNRAELFPAQLSGGELQRVSLARALAVNPKLILADEPTGNVDWDTADKLMDLFEKVNREGKTIIMATHHRLIVGKLKKRVIELKEGKVVGISSKPGKKAKKMKVRVEETKNV